MNEKEDSANGQSPGLTDDELADLERELESGGTKSQRNTVSVLDREHRDAFLKIDLLAAPIRAAISAADLPPDLLDYEAIEEIGRGGMGIVYRALHKKTQRHDAIKVIRHDRLIENAGDTVKLIQWRFQQESKLAARVAHQHIVPIYQVGEVSGQPWFSMQLVDGQSLKAMSRGVGIAPERAARYIESIARAISVVHQHGIIHGDIKPHNILVETKSDRPMITDFGLADLAASCLGNVSGGVAGTPAYMAPELARATLDDVTSDEAQAIRSVSTDIYSLGATLWSILAGRSPCSDSGDVKRRLTEIANGHLSFDSMEDRAIPPGLNRIIRKCVALNPDDRYSASWEVADDLATWLCRPHWNRHFPGLRSLLWMLVAPVLVASGIGCWWLLQTNAHEVWIWLLIFFGYGPLFATFLASGRDSGSGRQARRELWSIWMGHLVSTFVCMVALRILCDPDFEQTLSFFYPCWAAISSLVFFAKSGNFWTFYRWIGLGWASATVALALTPVQPIVFGVTAAVTCVLIAFGDRSFLEEEVP